MEKSQCFGGLISYNRNKFRLTIDRGSQIIQSNPGRKGTFMPELSTREKIIVESERLFRKYGYDGTSMKKIADTCGISTGNLTFYFPKKEDLLMTHHNILMQSFLSQLPEDLRNEEPWDAYFAVEYCFMHELLFVHTLLHLYLDVINIESLRKQYYDMHHKVFLSFVPEDNFDLDSRDIYFSTVMTSAVEFHLSEQFHDHPDVFPFDKIMSYVFHVRLGALKIPDEQQDALIASGIAKGKELLLRIPNLRSLYDSY